MADLAFALPHRSAKMVECTTHAWLTRALVTGRILLDCYPGQGCTTGMRFTYDQQAAADQPEAANIGERERFARLLGGAEWLAVCLSGCEVVTRKAVNRARANSIRVDLLVIHETEGGAGPDSTPSLSALIRDKALGHRHLLVAEPASGALATVVEKAVPVIGLVRVTGDGPGLPEADAIFDALRFTPRIC